VQAVGGSDNVIAIVPSHVRPEAAAESPDSLVLRAPDAATAKELRKKLVASASQMAAVAGLLEVRLSVPHSWLKGGDSLGASQVNHRRQARF
jgi:cobalamin biosynthesis protein CobD/CbiB